MTATTELYIALQRVYAAQAEADRAAVATRVRELEASLGEWLQLGEASLGERRALPAPAASRMHAGATGPLPTTRRL